MPLDFETLKHRATDGNPAAMTILGICYLNGIEIGQDFKEALTYLSRAASLGVPRAMAYLSRMYSHGLGVDADLNVASRLAESAAQAGEFLAQVEFARICLRRNDRDSALQWFQAAAAQAENLEDCEELQEARAYIAKHGHT
jgi:uncharacterized protein